MKTKLLLPVLVATTFAAAGLAGAAPQPLNQLGSAALANAAVDQVVVITDATRHVNVTAGSTVRFVVGDQSFTWTFQTGTAHVTPFDLESIAPQGLLKHPVTTYVADGMPYLNP
jgi:hypothetical protein